MRNIELGIRRLIEPQAPRHHFIAGAEEFQSSPGPKTGCNSRESVSLFCVTTFQSSPGPKTGCNSSHVQPSITFCQFQSSPGPKTGCNYYPNGIDETIVIVSILTRPEDRVQPPVSPPRPMGLSVSILTRPEDRVQPFPSTSGRG